MMKNAANAVRGNIKLGFDIAWGLTEYHLNALSDDECFWKPATKGLCVNNGELTADWPESEDYGIGPPNIAWLTWHIIFWWETVLDYSFGGATLKREDVRHPGTAAAAVAKITQLQEEWRAKLNAISDEELLSCERTKWPFENKPFHELAAWLNLELMKNAAEIGYCRFLYAAN